MKITPLATEKDNQGNDVNILRTDSLALSPIYTFFLRQMASLMDSGFAYPTTHWNDGSCGAVYAEQDGKILGHIVYSTDNVKKMGNLWIVLSAVDESCRGRGIYTLLHKHFEDTARELGCWAISSHVHKNNKVRLASCAKVGMAPVFHYMGKKL